MAEAIFSLDLHVLSIPPAFALSQDQTLQFDFLKLLLISTSPAYLLFNFQRTRHLIIKTFKKLNFTLKKPNFSGAFFKGMYNIKHSNCLSRNYIKLKKNPETRPLIPVIQNARDNVHYKKKESIGTKNILK